MRHRQQGCEHLAACTTMYVKSGLTPRLIDLVFLRVSQINGCAYCIDTHSRDLLKGGLPVEHLMLIAVWREAGSLFREEEKAALAWAEIVTRLGDHGVPERAFESVAAVFDEKQLADLTIAIALINAYNRIAISFGAGPSNREDRNVPTESSCCQSGRTAKQGDRSMTETDRAVLAGGCFWGMQDLIRKLPGVEKTRVGYTGGEVPNATYRNHEGHAEAIEILFDPDRISYRELLEFFFQIHDPTTKNRQGNDVGSSYRSAIFYTSEQQRDEALRTIEDANASGIWPGKVVTEVEPAREFWEAEPEHQDYLERIPNGYTCHFPRPNWRLPRKTVPA